MNVQFGAKMNAKANPSLIKRAMHSTASNAALVGWILTVVVALIGWRFTDIYESGQAALKQTQVEVELLRTLFMGSTCQRIAAVECSQIISNKFKDDEFIRVVLRAIAVNDEDLAVRQKAHKMLLKMQLDIAPVKEQRRAKEKLEHFQLGTALGKAYRVYKDELYVTAVVEFEKATGCLPFKADVNLDLLEKARHMAVDDPESACHVYHKFFEPYAYLLTQMEAPWKEK
jgi:hypothetical protein